MTSLRDTSRADREERDFSIPPPPMRYSEESRFWRKVKENPFVPIGMFATVCALGLGLFHFNQGNAKMQQKMMRARVIAQGSTVLFLVGGIALEMMRQKKKDS